MRPHVWRSRRTARPQQRRSGPTSGSPCRTRLPSGLQISASAPLRMRPLMSRMLPPGSGCTNEGSKQPSSRTDRTGWAVATAKGGAPAGAGICKVITIGGSGEYSKSDTHRVKVTLRPVVGTDEAALKVNDDLPKRYLRRKRTGPRRSDLRRTVDRPEPGRSSRVRALVPADRPISSSRWCTGPTG
ncbi:trypco2 family protein [Micromonospora trifolii]|uniref:trypco2 family protein n=1 Tax=Micromonospora trifolii TaxID=2911208 RepID=UPI003D2E9F0D